MFPKQTPVPPGQAADPLNQKLRLISRLRNGASWFYWIAALSVINTVLLALGSGISFIFGLGMTEIIDALVFEFSQVIAPDSVIVLRIFGWAIMLLIVLIFALFGFYANKRQRWAFIAGMIVYALDAIAVLFIWERPDWLAFLFHIFVMWGLVNGFRAIGQLEKLDEQLRQAGLLPPEPPPSVIQPA